MLEAILDELLSPLCASYVIWWWDWGLWRLLGVYVFPPGNVPLSANIVQSTTDHHKLAGVCRGKWHGSTRITQAPEVDIFVDN